MTATGILPTDLHLTGDETLSPTALAWRGPVTLGPGRRARHLDAGRGGPARRRRHLTTVVVLVRCLAAYAVLVVAEAVRPRFGYAECRWATVFPLGMTAAAPLSVATSVGVPWLRRPGRVLEWVAVAVWLPVAAGAVADAVRTTRAGAAGER
ncbi:hypothetical protein [Streptomyces misionensis]|uniref:hypothetical protein n=1 Tax=Streptomyces misionensis TaxID=67331 RepID=UPI0028F6EBD9|nr:hypothetical protein [Streptomyces misionensis]